MDARSAPRCLGRPRLAGGRARGGGDGPRRAVGHPRPGRGRGPLSPVSLVRITGACEVAGALGLLNPRTRPTAGAALLIFLAAVFPANAYAAKDPQRFGPVAVAFWPRLAIQALLAGLVAFAAFPLRRAR